jgi:hypothetical protein
MKQITIFDKTIRVDDLKKGKLCCEGCGRKMRAYAKTLDTRLLDQAYEIRSYLERNNKSTFRAKDVFHDDHQKINDFQKLGYWKIIEKQKLGGKWKLTFNGRLFLENKRPLPDRIWVFNNKAIDWEEELLMVSQINPRWQESKSDYTMDYVNIKQGTLV